MKMWRYWGRKERKRCLFLEEKWNSHFGRADWWRRCAVSLRGLRELAGDIPGASSPFPAWSEVEVARAAVRSSAFAQLPAAALSTCAQGTLTPLPTGTHLSKSWGKWTSVILHRRWCLFMIIGFKKLIQELKTGSSCPHLCHKLSSWDYVCFVTDLGPKVMETQKPFEDKHAMMKYHLFMVLFLCMCVMSLWCLAGWGTGYSFWCGIVDYFWLPPALRMASSSLLYYFSKFIKPLDNMFFVLPETISQETFLHVFIILSCHGPGGLQSNLLQVWEHSMPF